MRYARIVSDEVARRSELPRQLDQRFSLDSPSAGQYAFELIRAGFQLGRSEAPGDCAPQRLQRLCQLDETSQGPVFLCATAARVNYDVVRRFRWCNAQPDRRSFRHAKLLEVIHRGVLIPVFWWQARMNIDTLQTASLQPLPNAPVIIGHPDYYPFEGAEKPAQLFRRLIENRFKLDLIEFVCGVSDSTPNGELESVLPAKQLNGPFEAELPDRRACQQEIANPPGMNDERAFGIRGHQRHAIIDSPNGVI